MRENTFLQKPWVVFGIAIFCNVLWGSAFPAVKSGYALFQVTPEDTAAQILFAGIRFFCAGALVLLFTSLRERKLLLPEREQLGGILQTGLVQTVLQYFFYYVGMAHTTGVKASILMSSNVFFTILVVGLLFRMEKLTGKKLLGCLLGFVGVVLINLPSGGVGLELDLFGDGFILLSAFANGFASVLIKKHSRNMSPVLLNGCQFMFGGAIMIVGALVCGGRLPNVTGAGVALMAYLAMLSAVAYSLWSVLLKHNPVSKVTVYSFTNPIFGVTLSALILKEGSAFGLKGAAALLLVCIGIILVNRAPRSEQENKD